MARIWRALKLGMKSLLLHKLRSGLTVLGIVFGVAAVISMLAIAEGTSRAAQEQIRALGATNIIIRSVKPSDDAQASGGNRPVADSQLWSEVRRFRPDGRDRFPRSEKYCQFVRSASKSGAAATHSTAASWALPKIMPSSTCSRSPGAAS